MPEVCLGVRVQQFFQLNLQISKLKKKKNTTGTKIANYMHLKNCFFHILPTKFVKHFLRELLVGSLAEEGRQHPATVHQTK